MSNCSADGRHVYFGSWEDQSHKFEVDILRGYIGFHETWAAKPLSRIERVDLDTGRHEIVFEEQYWIGHVNTSPTQPHLLTFCHEGNWDKVDNRIWGLDASSGKVWKIRPRGDAREVVVHEYWFNDGIHVGYHGFSEQGKLMLGHVRFDDSDPCECEFPGETGHIFSLDDKLIVGDGGGVIRIWRREGDPFEYARAVRVFPESTKVQVEMELTPAQADARLEIELCDAAGRRPVRVMLSEAGAVQALGGSIVTDLGKYVAGKKLTLIITVNTATGRCIVKLNGGATQELTVAEAQGTVLQRLSLRTGVWRAVADNKGVDSATDVPLPAPSVFQVQRIKISAP